MYLLNFVCCLPKGDEFMPNINELLRDHITLEIECLDRIYLNGYLPSLQIPGQLIAFLVQHRKQKIPSPALLKKITQKFIDDIKKYAEKNNIPIILFKRGERKDDIAAKMRRRCPVKNGVVFIGIAQEKAYAFKGRKKKQKGYVGFDYSRQSVFVNHYYFYLNDDEFGPGFIKICSYVPFPIKVYINGHEWVKRQLEKKAIAFESLDNGFLACSDPKRVQKICDQLSASHIQMFFNKWINLLPYPLTEEDLRAGYFHRLSVWQLEVSLTQVFDRPLRGRQFFEEVIRDNLDQGRPDRIQLLFERKVTKRTPGRFQTRVIQDGVHPSLHVNYKKSHVKQYFKENRALRTETTINDPKDFAIGKDLSNLPYLQEIGRHINRRLLDVQRVSQNCALSGQSIERIVKPTVTKDGQRASGLKLGDPRVMALFIALTLFWHLVNGFRNADLRKHMADLLDMEYKPTMMSYDLRRLVRKGIIYRVPKTNRYILTPYGFKVCRFFARLDARVFRPALVAMTSSEITPYPKALRKALDRVDREIDKLIAEAIPLKDAA
jgi:hypothetical protein